MNVSRKEAYLKLSRYFGKQGEDEYEDLVEVLYQSPQLSDDVELLIDDFNNVVNRCNRGNIHSNRLTLLGLSNEIKQHIQAITNENSELKEENERLIHDTMALNRINKSQANEHKRLKEAIEASQTNAQSLGEWTLQQWDKLNKISSIMDSAYKQSENGMNFDSTYYFNQILKVLKE